MSTKVADFSLAGAMLLAILFLQYSVHVYAPAALLIPPYLSICGGYLVILMLGEYRSV